MKNASLEAAVRSGVTLVELIVTGRGNRSPEVIAHGINQLSSMIFAAPYPSGSGRAGGAVIVQVHPQFLLNAGVHLVREPMLDIGDGSACYKWKCDTLEPFVSLAGDMIETAHLSQPGGYDEGNQYKL